MAAEHSQSDCARSVKQDVGLRVAGKDQVALAQPVGLDVELSAEEHGSASRHMAVRGDEEPGR